MSEQDSSEYKKIFTFRRISPGDSVPIQVTRMPVPTGTAPQSDSLSSNQGTSGMKSLPSASAVPQPGAPQAPGVSSLVNPVITLPQTGTTVNLTPSSNPLPGIVPSSTVKAPSPPDTGSSYSIKMPSPPDTGSSSTVKAPSLPVIAPISTVKVPSPPDIAPNTSAVPPPPDASSSLSGAARSQVSSTITPPGVALTRPSGSASQSGAGLMSQLTSATPSAVQGNVSAPPPLSGMPLINVTSKSLDSVESQGSGVPRAYVNAMREKVSYMLNFQVKVTSLTKHLRGLMRKTARSDDGDIQVNPPGQ